MNATAYNANTLALKLTIRMNIVCHNAFSWNGWQRGRLGEKPTSISILNSFCQTHPVHLNDTHTTTILQYSKTEKNQNPTNDLVLAHTQKKTAISLYKICNHTYGTCKLMSHTMTLKPNMIYIRNIAQFEYNTRTNVRCIIHRFEFPFAAVAAASVVVRWWLFLFLFLCAVYSIFTNTSRTHYSLLCPSNGFHRVIMWFCICICGFVDY